MTIHRIFATCVSPATLAKVSLWPEQAKDDAPGNSIREPGRSENMLPLPHATIEAGTMPAAGSSTKHHPKGGVSSLARFGKSADNAAPIGRLANQ